MRRGMIVFGCLIGLWALVAGAVLICPHCAHEYQAGDAVCGHCGAALPASEGPVAGAADVVVPPPAPPVAATPRLTAGDLAAGARQATAAFEAGDAPLALVLARNILALCAQDPAADPVRTAMVALRGAAVQALDRFAGECPACEGTGRRVTLVLTLSGEERELQGSQPCAVCQGRGQLNGHRSLAEMDPLLEDAWRRANLLLTAQGYDRLGAGWYPAALRPAMTRRAQAPFLSALGGTCSACHGLGGGGCEACAGSGRQACPESACRGGQTICPECQGQRRVSTSADGRALQRTCPRCLGRGIATCETCGGAAAISCATCEGQGRIACAVCQGRGQLPLCTRCAGTGLTECRRCRGSGRYRDAVCATCNGEGVELCRSCDGGGHQSRRRR